MIRTPPKIVEFLKQHKEKIKALKGRDFYRNIIDHGIGKRELMTLVRELNKTKPETG